MKDILHFSLGRRYCCSKKKEKKKEIVLGIALEFLFSSHYVIRYINQASN